MTTENTWQHSWPWPVWAAVLLGLALAALVVGLYRWEPHGPRPSLRATLAGLRVLALWLLVWMMFGWMWQQHRTEPADLIIALDDSASMAFTRDNWEPRAAAAIRRSMPGAGESPPSRFDVARQLVAQPRIGWLETLTEEYHVRLFLVADTVREVRAEDWQDLADLRPDRPASQLGSGVQTILEAQRQRPTAAMILLTDGATTAGPSVSELAALARDRSVPLFPVGIGSQRPVPDLRLADLLADDAAFLDDFVTVACQLVVDGITSGRTTVRLTRTDTGEKLAEQTVSISSAAQRGPVHLSFPARSPGEYSLLLEATPVQGEADTSNNRLTHRLNVHDRTLRVLLAQAAPSYEFRNLENLLSRATKPAGNRTEKAFDVHFVLQEADPEWIAQQPGALPGFPLRKEELTAFDVVVLGDADPTLIGQAALTHLAGFVRDHAGGLILCAGPRYLPWAYRETPLGPVFPIDLDKTVRSEDPVFQQPFSTRLTSFGQLAAPCRLVPGMDENAQLWQQLPKLYWYVDLPDPGAAARVLIERQAENGDRSPLALFQYVGTGRVLFHATDETYRWARHAGTDEYYERYWLQLIRYAGRSKLLQDQSPATIELDRRYFAHGESVPIRVRFRQAGLTPGGTDAVAVVLEAESGTRRTVPLQAAAPSGDDFAGAASGLGPGRYRVWLAAPALARPPASPVFEVAAPAQEQLHSPLNHADLKRAAEASGGRYFTPQDAERLSRYLPDSQRVRVESLPFEPIWNSSWIAAGFLALLACEWILRKRSGLL